MKIRKRSIIQASVTGLIVLNCIIYYRYINDLTDFRLLSLGDLNPYGGWSNLKSLFTDMSYRWRGITPSVALTTAIALTSLLFGRIFCGYICPVGALQDFFNFTARKLGVKEKKLPQSKSFQPEIIKYFILMILLALSVLGLGHYLSYTSVWLAYLNLFTGIFTGTGFMLLLTLVLFSLFYRRIFCRCLCPLGAIQALLYAMGPLKIAKDQHCDTCLVCLKNCPVEIKHDISPECIHCLQCVEGSCIKKTNGYAIRFAGKKINKNFYIFISIGLLLSLYILLPLDQNHEVSQSIVAMGDIKDGSYQGMGVGFGGNIQVKIHIDHNKIKEIDVIDHRETTGYYEEVYKDLSREMIKTQNLNIDVISGATSTSRGFLSAVKSGVSQALNKD